MLNHFIEVIKNTTITTIGLIVGLFGVDNANFLKATNVDLQTNQEQAINLSDYSQANILDAVSGETAITTDETNTIIPEESQSIETTGTKNTTITQNGTEYFVKEDIPSATFTRPESLITKTVIAVDNEEKLITLGEGASEDTRVVNPIKSAITKKEVDVVKILNTNFDKFDSKLQITEITEDDNNFFVSYQYLTLAVENRVWDEVIKEKNISIAKNILEGKDLSVYLSEELAEVIDTEIVYLKEVQEIQKIKKAKADKLAQAEAKKRTVASAYSSLIGKVLQVDESEFGNYEPIVKKKVDETKTVSDIVIGGTTTTTNTETTTTTNTTTPVETVVENNTTSTGIVDNQAPLLVVQGNNPALIQIGSSYADLGAKVTDNISEGLGINVGGDVVDTETKGSYFVVYSATDEAGNTATATREVIVYDYGVVPDVEQIVDTIPVESEETTTSNSVVEEVTTITPIEIEEEITTPEEEIATTTPETGIVQTVIETTTNAIDSSVETVQQTFDAVVETTTNTINTSAEAVQETIDNAVENTAEVVGDSVDAVIETTSEVAEQVTAMILSINIRELLGNIGAAGEGQIIGVTDILDKTGGIIYTNINKVIDGTLNSIDDSLEGAKYLFENVKSSIIEFKEKTKDIIFSLVDTSFSELEKVSDSATEGVMNTAQILSSGVYEVIGNMADGSYGAFNLIWKKVRSFSEGTSSKLEENTEYMSGNIQASLSSVKEVSDSATEGIANISQILSSGVYEVIGNMADGSFSSFNFVWKKVRGFSDNNSSVTEENVGSMVESILEISLENESSSFDTFVKFIIFSVDEAKRVVSNSFEKIAGVSSLASIKYSNNDDLKEKQGNDMNKIEMLKNKISGFSDGVKNSLLKTKEFLKETSPTIKFKETENE
ncbi:DUF5011 domain-containing protein [Patescibacteria group bacterium]|nr:DUF5011 domain-containing protein [Patescibacteria group bacterium]